MVNKVILVGNVGQDPEVRYLDNNLVVARFSLATTERGYTTQSGTQVPDRTEWHRVVVWRKLAEIAEKYVKKGSQLYVEGRIRTQEWTDQNGVKRYTTEIQADTFNFLGRKSDNDGNQSSNTASSAPNNNSAQTNAPSPQSAPTPPASKDPFGGQDDEVDDLPF